MKKMLKENMGMVLVIMSLVGMLAFYLGGIKAYNDRYYETHNEVTINEAK